MEGIAGIAIGDQTIRGSDGYPPGQALMTGETNAAIAGAFDAGAESVTVSDSHGTMDNLLPRSVSLASARFAFTVRREVASPDEVLGLTTVWSNLAMLAMRGRLPLLNR